MGDININKSKFGQIFALLLKKDEFSIFFDLAMQALRKAIAKVNLRANLQRL
jgi:hypothetical protein